MNTPSKDSASVSSIRPNTRAVWAVVLIAVAVLAVASVAAWMIEARNQHDYYTRILKDFGAVGSRSHFDSARAWRAYLDECKAAEEFLRTTPRYFARGGAAWTDDHETTWLLARGSAMDPSSSPPAPHPRD